MRMQEPPRFASMRAWICTYYVGGQMFGITIYASDPDQIGRDHPGVTVEGELISWVDN